MHIKIKITVWEKIEVSKIFITFLIEKKETTKLIKRPEQFSCMWYSMYVVLK